MVKKPIQQVVFFENESYTLSTGYKDDFVLLKQKIKSLGLAENNSKKSLTIYFSHVILHIFFIIIYLFSTNWVLSGFFLYCSTLSAIGITTSTHTASHKKI